MNPDLILEVLSDNKEDAKSIKEIAQAIGLDISSHAKWVRIQNTLARVLRSLNRWGWITHYHRQSDDNKKLWYNGY